MGNINLGRGQARKDDGKEGCHLHIHSAVCNINHIISRFDYIWSFPADHGHHFILV